MPCTTILVGKKVSFDGSTIISRNDDSVFGPKKLIVIEPKNQPRKYKSVLSHVEVELPDNPLRYICTPDVSKKKGNWSANGVNELNVGMTATETITSNLRVLGADPLVVMHKEKGKTIPGGIGEEDLVTLVIPYIKTAREGVLRLGELLEKYGTYESNGIAFNDANEVWWFESIGGHHWIARRVPDDRVVIMPNQFGLDNFDFIDAYGEKKEHLCSSDLKEFVEKNHLYVGRTDEFNPRLAFGSHSDSDHVYNTPRAWFITRYFLPTTYRYDGDNADFTPESDNIPWSFVPEHKVTIDDIKYLLSSFYQGTQYNPYSHGVEKGKYRSIGVPNTDVSAIIQIRGYMPKQLQAIEWISMGGSAFTACFPVYCYGKKVPDYLLKVGLLPSTNDLYWSSRFLAVLVDAQFATSIIYSERYLKRIFNRSSELLNTYDKKIMETGDFTLLDEANNKIVSMVKEETDKTLGEVLYNASCHMKTRYNRGDN